MFDRTQFDTGSSGVITTNHDCQHVQLDSAFGDFSAYTRATTRSADDSELETATP